MGENYWELFCATGAPIFYLLYRLEMEQEEQAKQAKTAWAERPAELL